MTAPFSRKEQEELAALLAAKAARDHHNSAKRTFETRYPWQDEFMAATAVYFECCLCAGNQVGKSVTGSLIDSFHLTGDYPEDFDGHRFEFAPLLWVLGYSMEKTRDLIQSKLFGQFDGDKFTGGYVPASRIVTRGWESAQGTPNAMRSILVKHSSGENSKVQFWSYSQGQHAMMGDLVDWIHVDEEPKDPQIRPQLLTRTINGDRGRGGRIIYTFTPENGRTELVCQFMDTPSPSQFFMQKGWVDAPHITPEKAKRLLDSYPPYQREMRSQGTPMLGHGRIYDLGEDFLTVDPFPIPEHWYVIDALDFGWDHPQAHVQLVEDRDQGVFYLTKAFKSRMSSAAEAWSATKAWAKDVPTAWPHDGLQHEKGRTDSRQQRDHYAEAGFDMLAQHAQWPAGGNSVESGVYELGDLMRKGKFKVFKGLVDFFNEYRQYHRDDRGRIVKTMDDVLDAVRYAYMMRRYAVQYGRIGVAFKPITFTGWGGR
jgi:phage terminase large subunit-like protein